MSDPQGPAVLNRLIGYNLRRATSAVLADYAASLGPGALRPTQMAILACVRGDSATTAAAIGRRLAIKKGNLTPLIAELEGAGLIANAEIQPDRRSRALSLTPLGQDALADTERKVLEHERRLLAGFTPSERETLLALLNRLWADPAADAE